MPQTRYDLVIGADGTIGSALLAHLRAAGIRTRGTSRRPQASPDFLSLDLARVETGWQAPRGVEVAYLTAAVARLLPCESDPEGSARVNVHGAVTVARALVEAGTFVVFLSTNQVFDGSLPLVPADAPTCPLNAYGRQKATAEREMLRLGPSAAVVRLTKVVVGDGEIFHTWREALCAGDTVEAFIDMVLAPIPLDFAVTALAAIGRAKRGGIWQISGPDDIAYVEAARLIAQRLGQPEDRVRAVSARERGFAAHLTPRHTTLDTSRLRQELALIPPPAATVLG
jgi:dTDP-4-dehydrorhamnose reductase